MNLHSTSIAVCGLTAELLGAMDGRARGIYVSHLVETRPAPKLDTGPRTESAPLRLRLSDVARTKLGAVTNASRYVDALVRDAWAETVNAAKELRDDETTDLPMPPSQIAAAWRLAHAFHPISHSHLFMAIEYAVLDRKRWGIARDTATLFGISNLGQNILDLARLVPLDAEAVLAEAIKEADRQRRTAKMLKKNGPAHAPGHE